MRLSEIFRAVFTNILTNKFRVFLTALGIIVGSLTIVLVVAIGEGSQAAVQEQFARLSVGTIFIMPSPGEATTAYLSRTDLDAVTSKCPSVSSATITVNGKGQVSYYNTAYAGYVLGIMQNFGEINNLTQKYGDFLTQEDVEQRRKVAVIGSDLADILFPGEQEDAVGKFITVERRKYEVVGILKRLGDFAQGINIDESVILPYDVAVKDILGTKVKPRITAVAMDINHVKSAIDEIGGVLKETQGKKSGDFIIRDAGSKLGAAQDSAKTMSILLVAVAGIVLIVGGIGIMNVLFVSIKERTREIGILKALGSKKRDILLQFLLEAIMISVAGGLLGVLLGIVIIPLMKYIDIKVIPSIYGNILAMAFAAATGTFFGYYPATKAASLKPIDALSYE